MDNRTEMRRLMESVKADKTDKKKDKNRDDYVAWRKSQGIDDRATTRKLVGLGEADHEVSMAGSQMQSLFQDAQRVIGELEGMYQGQDIPAWIQAKITKASDYMSSVASRLDHVGMMHEGDLEEGYYELPPIDRERYNDRSGEGLEGPIQTKSGKVVYYDPREGKYYDIDTDMYLSYDEFRALDGDSEISRIMELSGVKVDEAVAKIACVKCDEVSTEKAWQKNRGTSSQGVAESASTV